MINIIAINVFDLGRSVGQNVVQHGDQEGGCLSGPCLGTGHQIPPGQHCWYGVLLHWGWLVVLGQVNAVADDRAEGNVQKLNTKLDTTKNGEGNIFLK